MLPLNPDEINAIYFQLCEKYKYSIEETNKAIRMDMLLYGYIQPSTQNKQDMLIERIKREQEKIYGTKIN
jgi:hypothetical protein